MTKYFNCDNGECIEPCEACSTRGVNECLTKAEKEQFEHHFYKAAENFREEIKIATLKKAALKYKEPFNPSSWTIEQLAKHAMAENYDQQNYIFGMYQRLLEQEKKIEFYEDQFSSLSAYIERIMDYKKGARKEVGE